MPASKHRRKPGQRHVKHPAHAKLLAQQRWGPWIVTRREVISREVGRELARLNPGVLTELMCLMAAPAEQDEANGPRVDALVRRHRLSEWAFSELSTLGDLMFQTVCDPAEFDPNGDRWELNPLPLTDET